MTFENTKFLKITRDRIRAFKANFGSALEFSQLTTMLNSI